MSQLIVSRKKAIAISNGVFLVCLAFMVFTNLWWPWMVLAVGATIALRQYLTGRDYYAALTTFIALLLFGMEFFNFGWHSYMPALLLIGGIFIIIREVYFSQTSPLEDKSEEIKDDADL